MKLMTGSMVRRGPLLLSFVVKDSTNKSFPTFFDLAALSPNAGITQS